MFELRVRREFCAAHALTVRGVREPTHGHNWRVTVVVSGDRLDEDGLLCDFHEVEQQLNAIIAELHNQDLNAVSPFDAVNPTAEHVARHIGESLNSVLPPGVTLARTAVTEAPGCEATWIPTSR
jgi:6-pyruvoyltetrahydropterin/6-carboxytetrahydropterin synthase